MPPRRGRSPGPRRRCSSRSTSAGARAITIPRRAGGGARARRPAATDHEPAWRRLRAIPGIGALDGGDAHVVVAADNVLLVNVPASTENGILRRCTRLAGEREAPDAGRSAEARGAGSAQTSLNARLLSRRHLPEFDNGANGVINRAALSATREDTYAPDAESSRLSRTAWQIGRRAGGGIVARHIGYAQTRGPARAVINQARVRRVRSARARLVPRASRAGRSTPASTSRARRSPTRRASAPTSRARSRSSACRSFAIRAATSSPATTGSTASARRRSGRRCSSGRGTRSRRTSSAPTSSSTGAGWSAPSRCSGMNFGTGTAEMAVAYVEYCNLDARHEVERAAARRTATSSRTTCATGASATRWTGRGRSASMQAREYGRKARDAAQQMRVIDRGPAADRLRIERHRSCRRISSGIARCWRSATTRWTASRCTPTTATRRR